jgi:hypothetical protein
MDIGAEKGEDSPRINTDLTNKRKPRGGAKRAIRSRPAHDDPAWFF